MATNPGRLRVALMMIAAVSVAACHHQTAEEKEADQRNKILARPATMKDLIALANGFSPLVNRADELEQEIDWLQETVEVQQRQLDKQKSRIEDLENNIRYLH
ncbi:hypothetical protein [Emcibacter sp. SYSU 3D8]|uniref:hypothetical protein n=1 Tax=Emcibacter sp. SYSU 3D8 TaxID=3133969 RepID=UPI0031FF34F5